MERIRLLKLEVSADTIRYSICTSKLKIKPNNCVLVGESIIKVKQESVRESSIADSGSGAFLTPGSGMGKKSGSVSGMNNPDHISWSLETIFLGLQYSNSLMRIREPGWKKFGSGIRDGKKSDPGSRIYIPDPQH